jgi:hypothetical protein
MQAVQDDRLCLVISSSHGSKTWAIYRLRLEGHDRAKSGAATKPWVSLLRIRERLRNTDYRMSEYLHPCMFTFLYYYSQLFVIERGFCSLVLYLQDAVTRAKLLLHLPDITPLLGIHL